MHGKTHCASIIPSLLHSWPTTYFTNIWTCAGTCMHTHTHTHIHTQFFFPSPLISKEDLALKNWCFWTVVLEKTLESPLDSKEIKPVTPKGNQPWIFIGRTDAEAEALILWPPDSKSWLIGKPLMLGKVEGKRRGRQRIRWLDNITNSMDMNFRKLQ